MTDDENDYLSLIFMLYYTFLSAISLIERERRERAKHTNRPSLFRSMQTASHEPFDDINL